MRRKILRISLIILLMLPVIAFAHFVAFPQETRCMLIGFSSFKKTETIYYPAGMPIDSLRKLQRAAELRVSSLWQENSVLDYKIIFCPDEKDYNRYGIAGTPACTQLKGGAYVVLSREGCEVPILAHEIAHTVLYNNIGWYKTVFKIPTWFNEGLAMQADDRSYYSDTVYLSRQAAGAPIPDVTTMRRPASFYSGDTDAIMSNFLVAKHVVAAWLKTHSLEKFILRINSGKSFDDAYSEND